MTSYKRPVFFDRDIKSFSELSASAADDLGVVAYKILADAALQVGTDGSAGAFSVKNASDVDSFTVDGSTGTMSLFGSDGQFLSAYDANQNAVLEMGYPNSSTGQVALNSAWGANPGITLLGTGAATFGNAGTAGVVQVKDADNNQNIWLNGDGATAIIGGPVAGTVLVRDASYGQTINLNGATATATFGGTRDANLIIKDNQNVNRIYLEPQAITVKDSADVPRVTIDSVDGIYSAFASNGQQVVSLNGYDGSATFGGSTLAGSVSVKNASNAQTISLDGATATVTLGANGSPVPGIMSLRDGFDEWIGLNGGSGAIDAVSGTFGRTQGASVLAGSVVVNGDDGNWSIGLDGTSGGIASKALTAGRVTFSANNFGHATLTDSSDLQFANATLTIGKDGATPGRFEVYSGADIAFWLDSSFGEELHVGNTAGAGKYGRVVLSDGSANTIDMSGGLGTITLSGAAAKITGLVTAEISGNTDAVNKEYVDAVAQGLDVKASCVAATTANITLSGLQTVGGVAVSEGARVLVKNQTDATENGIYLASSGAWTRSQDMNEGSEFPGAFTFIEDGDYNGTGWVCTNPSVTLGTTAITFTQFSGAGTYVAGAGISITGTTIAAVVDGTHAIINGSNQIDVAGVPALFTIDGLATSAATTAANLATLVDGAAGDAVALHSHSADAEYLPAAAGLAAGQAALINASGEAATAGTSTSGAWMVGVVESIASGSARVIRGGLCAGVLSGATPGDIYYVQADGTLGTALPESGRCVMAGIAKSATDLHVQVRDFGSILAA